MLQAAGRLPAGAYEITASVHFSNGETQKDAFTIHVLPRPSELEAKGKIALFDPQGETGKLLSDLKAPFQKVEADADLSSYDVLIVGKKALTLNGAAPDVEPGARRVEGHLIRADREGA